MNKAAIIYWSGTGNTEAMAGEILEGAREVNPETPTSRSRRSPQMTPPDTIR